MDSVTVFHFKENFREVEVKVAFDRGNLVISEFVDDREALKYYGVSDFTWENTIEPQELEKLYKAMGIPAHDKNSLLQKFTVMFRSNDSFQEIATFLKENKVEYIKGPGPISWF